MTPRSIREPGALPRDPRDVREPRLAPPPAQPRRALAAAQAPAPRSRPNANPLRLMLGLAGLASAAAITTAMLPSVTPSAPAADQAAAPAVVASPDPTTAPAAQHVTRYVQLQPGQTAPPKSTVVIQATPTPRVTVKVVTKTRQSGKP